MRSARRKIGALKYYGTVVCRHWILFFPILIFIPLAVFGRVGRSFGVQFLFRDYKSPFSLSVPGIMQDVLRKFIGFIGSAYFETQVYAVCLLGLMWVCGLLLEEKQERLNRTYLPSSERVLHYMPGVALL